ncbi:MAG: hypothetical protein JXA21_29960, partial [Anaerolineae bacterium]|nr:hypothetical protein [Anaerolineae bacterium]
MFIHDLCPRFIELLQQAGLLPPHDPQTAVPAREAGKEGCAYDTPACAQHCRRSTPRDAEARFIHYRGRNQAGAEDPTRARNVHGYRSYAFNLGD